MSLPCQHVNVQIGAIEPALRAAIATALQAGGHQAFCFDTAPAVAADAVLMPLYQLSHLGSLAASCSGTARATACLCHVASAQGMPTELPAGVGLIVGDDASGAVAQILQAIQATRDRSLLAALRTQHARLQAQFDQLATTAMDALCTLDLTGNFVEASPACERIWGYTQLDLLQKNFFEQTLPEDRAQVRAAAQAVRTGAEAIRFSCRQQDRSGKVLLLVCSFSWSVEQQCLLCTVRDETDRASHASALDVSQQHYQSLFDQNPDAVYSFDRDGNFVSVNRGAEQLCGYSRDELIGTNLLPMIAPECVDQTNAQFRHALAGQGVTYQTVLLRKDGQRVHLSVTNLPIVVNDTVVGVFGIAKNITDQIQAFEQKRQSEERFSNVARASTDTIWDWDLQADLLWWNDGLQNVFGYPAAEIEPDGSSWVSRIHPEDVDAVTQGIHAVIDGTGSSWTDQYRFRRFDGSYAWVVDRGFVIRDEHGKAVRMVGGMSDVSERKQSEMMLERLNRALRMLSACNQVLIRASSEQALLNQVCSIAREFGGYQVAWVGYVQNDAGSRIKPVAQAGIAAATLEQIEISWSAQTPAGRGPSGRAVRSGQPEVLERATNDPSFADWAEYAPLFGGGSVISLPLRTGGETIGVLTLHLTDTRAVPAEEMVLLGELADNLAYGIETRRVDDERRRLLSTVKKVATAVSANSHQSAQQFFEQLVRNMADAVGAQAALVTRFSTGECDHVDTIAAVIDGDTYPNFSYHIAGTACAQLIDKGECVERELISELAPGEAGRALGEMRAYVGRRLDNGNGSPIGTIFVMFRERLERVEHTLSALRIFAARVSAELERHAADQRIRDQAALLDHATDAIVVRNMDGSVTFWNKGAERLYGWTREEALGQHMLTRTAAESHDMQDILGNTVRDGEWRGELMQRRIDGQAVAVEARWTLIRDDDGAPQSILAIETDITQRKSAEHEIEHLAFYDRLTDLPNRLLLRNRLQHALETNERSGRMGALLCIDLDNFKALNDSLGHDTGDLLLQLVAVRLSYCLRASDTVARLGGDEFIILLVDLGDFATEAASRAKMVAEKILQAFIEPFSLAQQEGHTTPSIGITLFGNGQDTIDELLQRAELAMYQAKAAGRNTMQFFDPDMQAVVTARVNLESEIRIGLKQDQFLLHYQVQVDAGGHPTGAEALVRWLHPQRGLVSPAAFIPVAEETGLIIPLGSWVLESACRTLAEWAQSARLADLSIAVNVSARQFRQAGFVDEVLQVLHRTGANPRRLKLELTESLLIDSVEDTVLKMTQLKSRGVGFSLDDFGIGYSSLSYLKRLPLDQLKIDQSFVRDILTDPNDEAIARTIVALGNSLGLAVIAEGVETAEQKSRLAALGCFFYQGYFFSRPIPAAEFLQLIGRAITVES